MWCITHDQFFYEWGEARQNWLNTHNEKKVDFVRKHCSWQISSQSCCHPVEASYIFSSAVVRWQFQRSSGTLAIGTSGQLIVWKGKWHCKAHLLEARTKTNSCQKSCLFCVHHGTETQSSACGSLLLPEISMSLGGILSLMTTVTLISAPQFEPGNHCT